MRRYDVCTPRKRKDGKTFWLKVGAAFEGDKGIGIELDALPIADGEGRASLRLFDPRTKTGGQQSGQSATLDDDIPDF